MTGHTPRKARPLFEITGSLTVNPRAPESSFTVSFRSEAASVVEAFEAVKRLHDDLEQEIWNRNDVRGE